MASAVKKFLSECFGVQWRKPKKADRVVKSPEGEFSVTLREKEWTRRLYMLEGDVSQSQKAKNLSVS
jgi:hypothetical protein